MNPIPLRDRVFTIFGETCNIWHTVGRRLRTSTTMTKKTASPLATQATPADPAAGYRGEHEKDMVNRLRRIEGQVRGLVDMIQSGRSCEEVATQMSATRKAMDKAFYRMMTCSLIEAVHESRTDEEAIQEVERSARLLEKFA